MDKALIDADSIVYAAGFAGKKEGDDQKIEIVLHNTKSMIQNVLTATGCWDFQLYLTGKGNFREEVAVTHKYKGNRDTLEKPFFYNEIREYMIDHWGAIVVEGQEADDQVAIEQTENTCICTIDKDLKMVPGWNYNWNKDELVFIEEFEGLKWFYQQLLMGDMTDNIHGIKGIGPKKAAKILAECTTEKELAKTVFEAYREHFENPMERMVENGRLLWMRREEGELWQIPLTYEEM